MIWSITTLYTYGALSQLRFTDVDQDGFDDVIATADAVQVNWYPGPGLSAELVLAPVTGFVLAVADVDGDGDEDLLTAEYALRWLENLGGGSFAPETILIATPFTYAREVVPTDLDGDGDIDLVVRDDAGLWRVENLGGGAFGAAAAVTVPPSDLRQIVDMDGDGLPDLVLTEPATISVATNNGAGFDPAVPVCANDTLAPVAFDLDRDGDVDLVTGTAGGQILTWCDNLGGGAFAAPAVLANLGGAVASRLTPADLDGDVDLDLVFVKGISEIVTLENTGGALGGPIAAPFPASPYLEVYRISVEDVDGDRAPDILAVGGELIFSFYFADALRIHTNPGFADADGDGLSDDAEALYGTDPALADTDGDGVGDYDELAAYGDPLTAPPVGGTGDTGLVGPTGDTGAATTGDTGVAPPPADTSPPQATGDTGSPPEPAVDDSGCGGCRTGTEAAPLWLLGLVLLARVRPDL